MTAPLTLLRTFFVCAATTLLIACDSGGSSSSEIPEINSFKIYTANQTIYSFNESTRISTRRADFDSGDNQFIELDTDESKPGYDYAVYAFENGIYLLDYDKANSGKITKLTQYAENKKICNIIANKTASSDGFKDGKHSNRSTLDLPIITLEIVEESEDCSPLIAARDKLDFSKINESNAFNNPITKTAGSSDAVLGGLVIDYGSGSSIISNEEVEITKKGNVGFLGFNLPGSLLKFDYRVKDERDNWSANLVADPDTYPFSKQSSTDQVVVQNNESVYVLNADSLFTINSDASNIPIQSRIDALFQAPIYVLPEISTIETNRSQNTSTFLIRQHNNLYYFENGNFKPIPNNPIQNGTIVDFDLTKNNQALVVLENPDTSHTLLVISTQSGESTTLLTADKVELQVIDNEFYINTLVLEPGSGWQAHWFRTPTSFTSYNDSRFLFANDKREMQNTLLILCSDSGLPAADMINPAIYIFDKSRSNGRKPGIEKIGNTNVQVDFSYGQLNTDVSEIELISIINDRYGRLIITGINKETGAGQAVREHYYFDPSESLSSQDPDEQSLRLMHREIL